jgi:glucose/arabinose dehydrogenase
MLPLLLLACGLRSAPTPAAPTPVPDDVVASLTLPEGFGIEVYATVENARSLTHGPDGVVFVGTRRSDRVYALVPDDAGVRTVTVDAGLDTPNGVAWRDGSLFVAEAARILRYDGVAAALEGGGDTLDIDPVVVFDALPDQSSHEWKFLAFGPDGKLYVPIGAPCNVCERDDERFATLARLDPDGTDFEIVAHGVRNTVGFTWQPGTDVLWFTDNGRDRWGDDRPPDEINRAPTVGLDFGFPRCHGAGLVDPELGGPDACEGVTFPVVELDAHVAALGLRFYTGTMFPERYRGGIFHAEHGSWNRTVPIGYRVMFTPVDGDEVGPTEVFVEGWLGEEVTGRPVDVLVMDDGALLVSDDHRGQIYRVFVR